MEVQRRDNTPRKTPIFARSFNPKLRDEVWACFIVGINHLHDVEGLSWPAVAQVVGMGLTTLQSIRTRDRHPPLPALYFLADRLSLSMHDLLSLAHEED